MKISKSKNSDGSVFVSVGTPIAVVFNKYITPFLGASIALFPVAFLLNLFILSLPVFVQIILRLIVYIPILIWAFKVVRSYSNRPILKIYPGDRFVMNGKDVKFFEFKQFIYDEMPMGAVRIKAQTSSEIVTLGVLKSDLWELLKGAIEEHQ